MKAAANNITPITLELGGRNAAIVSDKANVRLAAKRILWGKAAAAGQTCFAPNVAIVHEAVYDEFVGGLKDVCSLSLLHNLVAELMSISIMPSSTKAKPSSPQSAISSMPPNSPACNPFSPQQRAKSSSAAN